MTKKEIIEFLSNATFEELKKLRVDSDHISIVDLPENYAAHLYFTIINSGKIMDRYFGWHEAEFNGRYYGSPVTHKKTFWADMREYENLTICLNVGEASEMNPLEQGILTTIDAKGDKRYFNESNAGGAKTKGQKSINALENIVFNIESGVYKIIKVSKDILYAIELYQVREVLEIPGKVQKILDLILDSKGEWLKDNHKFVLILEDFFGKGIHCRIGSYHTLKSCMKTDWVDEVNALFVPKNDWKNLDPTEIQDLGHTDNKKDAKANDSNSLSEVISNAVLFCQNNGISHTDDRVKDKFSRWGYGNEEWDRIRVKLRLELTGNSARKAIPPNQIKKSWTEKKKNDKIESEIDENTHAFILTTAWWSNRWVGFDALIKQFKDTDALQKSIWKIFWLNESDTAFLDWNKIKTEKDENGNDILKPSRKTKQEYDLQMVVSRFSEEIRPRLIFEDLAYSEDNKPKKND